MISYKLKCSKSLWRVGSSLWRKKKIFVVTNEPLLNQITVSFQHPKFLLLKRGFKLLRTKWLVGYCAVRVKSCMSYGRCLDTKTKLNKIQWSLNLPKPQEESFKLNEWEFPLFWTKCNNITSSFNLDRVDVIY